MLIHYGCQMMMTMKFDCFGRGFILPNTSYVFTDVTPMAVDFYTLIFFVQMLYFPVLLSCSISILSHSSSLARL